MAVIARHDVDSRGVLAFEFNDVFHAGKAGGKIGRVVQIFAVVPLVGIQPEEKLLGVVIHLPVQHNRQVNIGRVVGNLQFLQPVVVLQT